MRKPRFEGLWRHGDFMKLWAGQSISTLGGTVSDVALPLVAIVVVGATAFEFSVIRSLMFLPFLLFALPAGVWIDRVRRRPVVIGADTALGLALFSIPAAYWLGALTIWHLFVVAFVVGALEVFFGVAYRSYLPALVPRERLLEANAKLDVTGSAAAIAGPGVGGVLVGVLTAPVAIVVDAVSFFVSALFGLAIRTPEPRPEPAGPDRRLTRDLRAGVQFVLGNAYLRAIALTTAAMNFARSLALAVFLVYAVRELGVTAEMLGIVLACGNVGTLLGATLAPRISRRIGTGPAIVASAATIAPSTVLIALAPQDFPLPFLFAAQLLAGFGALGYSITSVSLRQAITPETLLARMNSVMVFLGFGAVPLGSLAGGVLASLLGLHAAIWIGAVIASLTFLPLVFSPIRQLRDAGEARSAADATAELAEPGSRPLDATQPAR